MKKIILLLALLLCGNVASTFGQDIYGRGRNPDTTYLDADDFNYNEIIKVDTSGGSKYFTGVDASSALSQPKKYLAIVSQSGTSNPTIDATLLNTLGANVSSITRTDVGVYAITFAAAVFTASKTTFETKLITGSFDTPTGYLYPMYETNFTTTSITFFSSSLLSPDSPADDILESAVIEITVYP